MKLWDSNLYLWAICFYRWSFINVSQLQNIMKVLWILKGSTVVQALCASTCLSLSFHAEIVTIRKKNIMTLMYNLLYSFIYSVSYECMSPSLSLPSWKLWKFWLAAFFGAKKKKIVQTKSRVIWLYRRLWMEGSMAWRYRKLYFVFEVYYLLYFNDDYAYFLPKFSISQCKNYCSHINISYWNVRIKKKFSFYIHYEM